MNRHTSLRRYKSSFGLFVVCAMQISSAACADTSGLWYAGLGIGQSTVDITGSDLDAVYGGVTATSVDDSDTAWKIFGGKKVMKNFGVEVAYMDYGRLTADSGFNPVPPQLTATIYTHLDTTAWMIDAVGTLLHEKLELFGKIGLARWNTDTDISATAGITVLVEPFDNDGNDLHFGAGVRYALSGNLGIRAEWERINADKDLDAWTVGAQYGF